MKALYPCLGLLLASCDAGGLFPLPDGDGQDVLRILSVGAEAPATRSIVTTDVLNTAGGCIGVYAVNADGTEYVPARGGSNTSAYEYDGTNWNFAVTDGSQLLRLPSATGETVKATAFYPFTLVPHYSTGGGSYASGVNILTSDDFAATKQTDYLYSDYVSGLSATSRTATFTLKHALAKLTFKVYRTSVLDETKLVGVQIIDAGGGSSLRTGNGKSMNLQTGALQGLVGQSEITLTASGDVQKQTINQLSGGSGGATATAYCLVAPAPSMEYLSLQITTSQGTAESEQSFLTSSVKMVTTNPSTGECMRWTAGNHYVFTVVLDGMKAGVLDIQVCQWESDTDTFIPIS